MNLTVTGGLEDHMGFFRKIQQKWRRRQRMRRKERREEEHMQKLTKRDLRIDFFTNEYKFQSYQILMNRPDSSEDYVV